jgi:hypothetical protein
MNSCYEREEETTKKIAPDSLEIAMCYEKMPPLLR